MTDLVLRDIDPDIAERIKRLADSRGWTMHVTLETLLHNGLQSCESGLHVHFNDRESDALAKAIVEMEKVANDGGYGLIGQVQHTPEAPAPAHVLDRWKEDL
ncbi:hypothetical protein LK996_09190 [Lysobacter sp. A6]|uniref:Uncharacterized protein n=1 Tax=Noviluteimonas lactosilytica TaxID=2888523 RepID=A0ABS8JI21_9GAMM|nr:hypothetical protein [Lysobacter lactosilyticus]MCC8363248.1 hypothetical protein [Lysobacter lactosilyticus]